MKDLVIVGDGGFAREVEWLVERINEKTPTWNFKGFVDKATENTQVVGDDNYLVHYDKELFVAIAIGSSDIRENLYKRYKSNPYLKYPNLIDPGILCSDRICFGEGNIICAGTILTVDICIGNCNIINLDCTVGHDTIINDFVTVNPSVNISGKTHIFSGCNIGTGTQILQGISIGNNTIIGAGAVVNKEIPANCTAIGVPAKVIKMRNDGADE